MENIAEYRLVPGEKAVYRIQEDCCYTKVIYEGAGLGIYNRFDRENEVTGILLCYCDPNRKIKPVSKKFFDKHYKIVTQKTQVT